MNREDLIKKYGSISEAARQLNISRSSLRCRLKNSNLNEKRAPEGLKMEKTSTIIEREVLDPVVKIVEVCKGIPDGQLTKGDDIRMYLGLTKTAWDDVKDSAQLTSFRCEIPKKGTSSYTTYFGNDQEISRMKKKRGVR